MVAPHGGLTDEKSIPMRMVGCKGVKGQQGVNHDGCVFKVVKDRCCKYFYYYSILSYSKKSDKLLFIHFSGRFFLLARVELR